MKMVKIYLTDEYENDKLELQNLSNNDNNIVDYQS